MMPGTMWLFEGGDPVVVFLRVFTLALGLTALAAGAIVYFS